VKHIAPSSLFRIATIVATLTLSLSAHAADKYTIVRNFNENSGGVLPAGALLMDDAGNLFGTNTQGGSHNSGTVFELTPKAGGGWTYTVLFQCGSTSDCSLPVGSLVMDQAGNLYGSSLFGRVFQITKTGSNWTANVLHNFGVQSAPPSPVILDAAGNLYGINPTGGKSNLGFVFELSPSASGWTVAHLHDFNGTDGAAISSNTENQVAGLVFDTAGNLYGTTVAGGTSSKCSGGCGVVFQLKNSSGKWTETVLHNFVGTDGANPISSLTIDSSGNLYGTASAGGTKGFGVAFQVAPVSGGWQTHILHNFSGAHLDGEFPDSSLVMDSVGNLYGTTESGGGDHLSCQVQSDAGCGTAYELSLSGGQWKETILKAFSGRNDGAFPQGVTLDPSGNLYGAAQAGGAQFEGLIFELSPKTP